jgi:hypothetical protein
MILFLTVLEVYETYYAADDAPTSPEALLDGPGDAVASSEAADMSMDISKAQSDQRR